MAVPTKDIFTSVHHLIPITNLGLSESNRRRDSETTPLSKEKTSRGHNGWQKKSAIFLISKLSRTVFSKTLHPCPVPQLLKGTFLSSIEQLHTLYSIISMCVLVVLCRMSLFSGSLSSPCLNFSLIHGLVHFWHDAREGSSTNLDSGQWNHGYPGATPISSGPFSVKCGWLALWNLLANPCRHAARVASITLLSLLCRSEAATSCRPNPVLWTGKDLQATEMKSEFKRTEISLETQNWS